MKYCCAGIVLFNPDLERLKMNVDALKTQVDHLILMDNQSENRDEIQRIYGEAGGGSNGKQAEIILLQNQENKGIATGLNQICQSAMSMGYEWTLLMDQDSICSESLIRAYEAFKDTDGLALLTPYIIDVNKMSLKEHENLKLPETSPVQWAITSGSLIRLEVWEKLGKFDEELFIDGVDLDFSLRLRINGYLQLKLNGEYILHEVGQAEPTWIRILRRDHTGKLKLKRYYRSNHSLMRQYFMTRNNLILARRYKNYQALWKGIAFTMAFSGGKLLVEKNRWQLAKTLLKGVRDGFIYPVIPYEMPAK